MNTKQATAATGPTMIDFKSGKLLPVDPDNYPVGTVVSYGDMANDRTRYAITGPATNGHGQPCASETGAHSTVSRSAIDGPGGWRLEDCPPMTAADLSAFLETAAATGARLKQEEDERTAKEAAETSDAQAKLRARYPFLTLEENAKKGGCVLAAANIRKLLKHTFPGHKFSVRSESFSMGNAVRISWEDGPTSKEVDELSQGFVSSGFDGMQDLSYHVKSPWHIFGNAKYVSTTRELSEPSQLTIAAEVIEETGDTRNPAELAEAYRMGTLWGDDEHIRRKFHETRDARSFYVQPEKVTLAKATAPAGPAPSGVAWEPIQTTHHAKKNIPLWVSVLAARVDRETFEALRARAKSLGGWWSRYNGNGAIPGFQFTTEESARSFIADGSPDPNNGGGKTPAPAPAPNPSLADRLDGFAKKLESEVEAKRAPMSQNPTPKRLREHGSRLCDASHLERGAQALRALAELHRTGEVSEALAGCRTKKAVLEAVRTRLDTAGAYYDPPRDTGEYCDTSPEAQALQALVRGEDPGEAKRRDMLRREKEVLLGPIPGYFPTPAPVVSKMLALANLNGAERILEPSAGNGNLLDALRETGHAGELIAVECNFTLAGILRDKGYEVHQDDFLTAAPELGAFDCVLMNPPFERGQDLSHIRTAAGLLKPGGVLVAIYASGTNAAKVEEMASHWEPLPEGSFKSSGTGTNARVCVIES